MKLSKCCVEMSEFITLNLLPLNSPDLGPFNHQIWATMHECVYHMYIHIIGELKQWLIQFCHSVHDIINTAIE